MSFDVSTDDALRRADVDRFAPSRVHELRLWQMNNDQNPSGEGREV